MDITKRSAKKALGFETDVELAKFLGVTKQALTRVSDDEALPAGHQWQLRAKRPDLFPVPASNPLDSAA